MKHLFKGLTATVAAAVMCVSVPMSASAARTYIGNPYSVTTSGGDSGKAKIKIQAYTDYYQPYGGVNVYYYGVEAWIDGSSSYTIGFTITGSVKSTGSSAKLPTVDNVNGHSASTQVSTTTYNAYNSVSCTVTAKSVGFGSVTTEYNANYN